MVKFLRGIWVTQVCTFAKIQGLYTIRRTWFVYFIVYKFYTKRKNCKYQILINHMHVKEFRRTCIDI